MALSWEDVVNKQFQPTKFREGYDQTEVDDFLDEIVAEIDRRSGDIRLYRELEVADPVDDYTRQIGVEDAQMRNPAARG